MNRVFSSLRAGLLAGLLLTSSCTWMDGNEAYLRIALTCKDFDLEYEKFLTPKTAFTAADVVIVAVAGIGNVSAGSTTSAMRFFKPDGSLHQERAWSFLESGDSWMYHYLPITGQESFWAANRGQWRVDVLIDAKVAASLSFTYD